MTREQILERLGKVLTESSTSQFDWSNVTEETRIDTLGFDSLTVLDLIFDMEEAFGLEIQATDIVAIKTVGSLATYLQERL